MSSEKEKKNPRPFTQSEQLLIAKLKKGGAKIEAAWDGMQCSFKTTGGTIRGGSGGDSGFTITGK
jgi:hypothetical protein